MKHNEQFQEKFGWIGISFECGLAYDRNLDGQLYAFPKNTTESLINQLMEKSVRDNHDYVYDLVKENKFEPIPEAIY